MWLNRFIDDISNWDAEPPFMCISLDLRPGPGGRPSAPNALRAAWANEGQEDLEKYRTFGDTIELTGELVDEAMRDDTEGIFLVASAQAPTEPRIMSLPIACRNDMRVVDRPWLFELERTAYFAARPVVTVFTDREDTDMMRVIFGERESGDQIEHATHALQKLHGRTDAESMVGTPTSFGGGHAWNKIENIVDEHRNAAARESAEAVVDLVQENDILVISGPVKSRSNLVNHLPEGLSVVLREDEGGFGTERERRAYSADLACRVQTEAADQLASSVLAGDYGELVARGREPMDMMFTEGRVARFVVHEDAVTHWGDHMDARLIEGQHDNWLGEALWKARETSAEVLFGQHPPVLHDHQGAIATLRW